MTNEITYLPRTFWLSAEYHPEASRQWHRRNPGGYGNRIPTAYKIKCSDGKTRRIYAICYSNAASHYVNVGRERVFVADWELSTIRDCALYRPLADSYREQQAEKGAAQ